MIWLNRIQGGFYSHNQPHTSSQTIWFFSSWPCSDAIIASKTKHFVLLTTQYSSLFLSLVFSLFVQVTFWQIQPLLLTSFSNFGWIQFWYYPWLLSASSVMVSRRLGWPLRIEEDEAEKLSTNANNYHIIWSLLTVLHLNSNFQVKASATLRYAPSSSTWLTWDRC